MSVRIFTLYLLTIIALLLLAFTAFVGAKQDEAIYQYKQQCELMGNSEGAKWYECKY